MDFKKKILFRLSNLQKGVVIIPYSIFWQKAQRYMKQYRNKEILHVKTNIERREDLSLESLCRDKVIEDYLGSGHYTFHRIGVLLNPFRYAPKTAVLLMCFQKPVRVEIAVKSGDGRIHYQDMSSLKEQHRISVTGLGQGKNRILLTVYDREGKQRMQRTVFLYLEEEGQKDPCPIVESETKTASAYPYIFITGGDLNPFVFHESGEIFHFMKFKHRTSTYGVYPIKKHKFLWSARNICVPTFANPHSTMFYEMDFMGRISRSYHVRKGMHHYVCEMPNGNLVAVSNSIEGHTEDILIELNRETGEIVREIYFKDIFGEKFVDQVDWAHANALEYNVEEDTMLICFRNIHSVIKLNWTTLEVKWLLSLPSLWQDTKLADKVLKPEGEVYYSFQGHAAYELTDFPEKEENLRFYLVYDNHRLNRRPIEGYAEDKHSYMNVYGIDEEKGTVKQVKHFQVDMSIVRSNARYDAKSRRIFNMAGCMWRHFTEYRGKVEEFDYETEQLLNRWYVKQDFFSGYPFEWKSDDYCSPLNIHEGYQYECGETDLLLPASLRGEETEERADQMLFSKPYIQGNNMYFYTLDHSISALMLVGREHCYERDYSNTWQTYKIHENKTYCCVISLLGLEKDHYQIKVLSEDTLYDTGYYVEIGE